MDQKIKSTFALLVAAGFLHGKMYHFQNGNSTHALLGSSNFTVSGLGLGKNPNVELNLVVDGNRDRDDLLLWFNDWWNNKDSTIDVKKIVLQELKRLYADNAPEFIYYLTLFHIFRDLLDRERDAENDIYTVALPDTEIWQRLYKFQKTEPLPL